MIASDTGVGKNISPAVMNYYSIWYFSAHITVVTFEYLFYLLKVYGIYYCDLPIL
jgi:hypothetical protein